MTVEEATDLMRHLLTVCDEMRLDLSSHECGF